MFKKIASLMLNISVSVFASSYIPSSQTSTGKVYGTMTDIYIYLYSIIRSICILSGVFLLLGGIYYFSQYRKDPVYMPLTKVLTMFLCAGCAFGLAFIPGGVNLK
jgi:hypothetical protein